MGWLVCIGLGDAGWYGLGGMVGFWWVGCYWAWRFWKWFGLYWWGGIGQVGWYVSSVVVWMLGHAAVFVWCCLSRIRGVNSF